jgi:hypothetical protein
MQFWPSYTEDIIAISPPRSSYKACGDVFTGTDLGYNGLLKKSATNTILGIIHRSFTYKHDALGTGVCLSNQEETNSEGFRTETSSF